MAKSENLWMKKLTADDLGLGKTSAEIMGSFFECMGKVLGGSYRRIQIAFNSACGKKFTATFYQCGSMATNSKKFIRIDVQHERIDGRRKF